MITIVLLVCALLCFILDCAGVNAKINLQSLGLAFYILSLLIHA